MNYIVLSNTVYDQLMRKYKVYCEKYNYTMALDVYMEDLILFEGVCRLYSQIDKETSYVIVGKSCVLYVDEHKYFQDCFFAKSIRFYDNDREYISKLSQTVELPGEWQIIGNDEVYRLGKIDATDIAAILKGLRKSNKAFKSFEEKWKTWDIYNTKLTEQEEKRELESESAVKNLIVENNIFSIEVACWKTQYEKDVSINALFSGEKKYINIGKIENINKQELKLTVSCEDKDIILKYFNGDIGKIEKIKVVDYGNIVRLKRQRDAMRKLFQEETANAHLKDILMGNYEFEKIENKTMTLEDAYGLFGTNIGQKQAYVGAVNADDIYLIQGPPGTGKTTIITELVKYFIEKNLKVLVSSETNIAVDNVLERVNKMEQVIPVRLGREERIGQEAIQFMPCNISSAILENSRGTLSNHADGIMNVDSLIEEVEAEYEKKEFKIICEINKKRASIPVEDNYEELFSLIEKYEDIVLEANEIYEELVEQKREYIKLSKLKDELQRQKDELEAYIHVVESGSMESGFKEADEQSASELWQYENKLSGVLVEWKSVIQKLSENTYETRMGAYQRKLKRTEKYREKLESVTGLSVLSGSDIYNIKIAISEVFYMKSQIDKLRESKKLEIEKTVSEYNHKKELWEISDDIRSEWQKLTEYADVKENVESIYMKKANAVFATCTGIASAENGIFADMEYDYVIIDEAAKCNMLDLLIPIISGKKIIFVGDHKQLYPMLDTNQVKEELSQEQINMLKEHILFKWLYEERVPKDYRVMLNRQYRMHPDISEFVSENFYDGQLICEKENDERNVLFWIDCNDSCETNVGTSYANLPEAATVVSLAKGLDSKYVKGSTVGIICAYKAQAILIEEMLKNEIFENISIECSTVDAFQGKEKHTIIFDIVRSSKITSFVSDENRVNVAISRAQETLYIVGKADIVKTKEAGILKELYDYVKKQGEIHNSRYINR